MLDVVFLALAILVIWLMAAYASALRRL